MAQNSADKFQVSSYSQIVRSSSIIGGAQGINYLVAMVRTKLVAVLLGPSGVGLVGLYVSATGLVGTVAGLGISSSGVREVAEAHGGGEAEYVARTVKTLRRVCWVTGILGWLLCAALAYPLSVYTFGSGERAWAVALLGATILIGSISGGQSALIQGTRRIGDLARMGVLGAVAGTIVAVGLYAWLGQKGIVPVLIVTAAVNLGFSWWFARKIPVAPVSLTWMETLGNSKRLIYIGVAFMYGAILASIVGLMIRSLIVKKYGLDYNGVYQAAWGISGMFAGFILNAMGADFYPRLTAVAHDNKQVNHLVNEQIEIGILLALPGLLGTLAFAPWLMRIFYTPKFLPGAELLPWFVLGIFGQVISWPVGFIQIAKGATRWLFVSATYSNALLIVLTIIFLRILGLPGTAIGFALLYPLHTVLLLYIARRLTSFRWSPGVLKLLAVSASLIGTGFALQRSLAPMLGLVVGAVLTTVACWLSLRGLVRRLGRNHRLVQLAFRVPGMRMASGL
jgi:antigen flippase